MLQHLANKKNVRLGKWVGDQIKYAEINIKSRIFLLIKGNQVWDDVASNVGFAKFSQLTSYCEISTT